jgi:large subunit ribosomal protein L16
MLKIPSTKIKLKTKKNLKKKSINKNSFINPYSFVLKVTENVTFNRNQVLMLNQVLGVIVKKRGKINFDHVSFNPYTKKSIGTRMGKGKGTLFGWLCCLKRGSTLVKIESFNKSLFNEKMRKKLTSVLPCSIYKISCQI